MKVHCTFHVLLVRGIRARNSFHGSAREVLAITNYHFSRIFTWICTHKFAHFATNLTSSSRIFSHIILSVISHIYAAFDSLGES